MKELETFLLQAPPLLPHQSNPAHHRLIANPATSTSPLLPIPSQHFKTRRQSNNTALIRQGESMKRHKQNLLQACPICSLLLVEFGFELSTSTWREEFVHDSKIGSGCPKTKPYSTIQYTFNVIITVKHSRSSIEPQVKHTDRRYQLRSETNYAYAERYILHQFSCWIFGSISNLLHDGSDVYLLEGYEQYQQTFSIMNKHWPSTKP